MVDFKIIYKVLGALLFMEAFLLLLCLLMSFAYGEDDRFAFSVSMALTLLGGFVLRYKGTEASNSLNRREAYLVVTLVWVLFSLFGTLPFLVSGYITSFTDAYFEAMSGFTTTGATIVADIEEWPHALLFWRSLMQWIGGLGIVFFTIALLPSMTGGSIKVFAAESTGPIKSKLHARLSTSAKWLWIIYALLTALCCGSFYLFGMGEFDAVNYAMTTVATGGFATHSASVEFFRSPAIEYACTFFCFLSGVNFILLYGAVVKGKVSRLIDSMEFKIYAGMTAVFTLFITGALMVSNGYGIEHAFRSALFTVVSFITTTGLFNDDAGQWPHITWIILTVCMFLGGMAGSTSGGFKCIRGAMLLKMIRNEFRQLLHPNAVLPLYVDGRNISWQRRSSLIALLAVWIVLFVLAAFVLAAVGVDSTNAITIIVSCLSNVGPTLGLEIGPTMSWADLPASVKWFCSLYMLIGRLEIFTVLVIFTPQFWHEN